MGTLSGPAIGLPNGQFDCGRLTVLSRAATGAIRRMFEEQPTWSNQLSWRGNIPELAGVLIFYGPMAKRKQSRAFARNMTRVSGLLSTRGREYESQAIPNARASATGSRLTDPHSPQFPRAPAAFLKSCLVLAGDNRLPGRPDAALGKDCACFTPAGFSLKVPAQARGISGRRRLRCRRGTGIPPPRRPSGRARSQPWGHRYPFRSSRPRPSLVSLQLAFPPMCVFAIGIEDPLMMAVDRPFHSHLLRGPEAAGLIIVVAHWQ
jgi:hypothetical protein